MDKGCIFFILVLFTNLLFSQDFETIHIDKEITSVQPMTGIVFWPGNASINSDAISLEFSYMEYNRVVSSKGEYNWEPVEVLLNQMASRNHQAVLRFRFTYPGRTTAVPDYIKALEGYQETEGITEGNATWFPDWSHPELKRFTIEFYEKYAEKYDGDPRLAFVQTGFGLWAEYHIYDGPFEMGKTFPDKAFQASFFYHLDTLFEVTNWNISIDAASSTYSPFKEKEELLELNFGLFDDSFMHRGHSGYNTASWNYFDRYRYKLAPAGGEFSYYSTYDQRNVLNEHEGAYGTPFEVFVEAFHMSYINGNDQNRYQSLDRIKAASMYMGYRFKINSFKTTEALSEVEIENVGVAPIYYDAYVTVNGIRSSESLKLLEPGATLTTRVNAGSSNPELTIECDHILASQEIQYYGTVNEPYVYTRASVLNTPASSLIARNAIITQNDNTTLHLNATHSTDLIKYVALVDLRGKVIYVSSNASKQQSVSIPIHDLPEGVYLLKTNLGTQKWVKK